MEKEIREAMAEKEIEEARCRPKEEKETRVADHGDATNTVKVNLRVAYNHYVNVEAQMFKEKNSRSMTRSEWADMSSRWKIMAFDEKVKFVSDVESPQPEKGRGSGRQCSISCRPGYFYKHVQELSAEQRSLADETGLGSLLKNEVVNLHSDLISWLASSFDPGSMTLNIYGRNFQIAASDVTEMMGIADGMTPFDFNQKSPWVKSFCKIVSKRWVVDVKGISERLSGSFGDDFKRMYVLLALATILCPSNRKFLGSQFVCCVDNVNLLRDHQWASFTLSHLVAAIKKVSGDGVHVLGGCSMFLQVYYMRFILPGSYSACSGNLPISFFTDDVMKKLLRKRCFREDPKEHGEYSPKPSKSGRWSANTPGRPSPSADNVHENVDAGRDAIPSHDKDQTETGKEKMHIPVEEFEHLVEVVRTLADHVGALVVDGRDLRAEQLRQRKQLQQISAQVGTLVQALKSKRVKDSPNQKKVHREDTHGSNAPFADTPLPLPVLVQQSNHSADEIGGTDDEGLPVENNELDGKGKSSNNASARIADDSVMVLSTFPAKVKEGKDQADVSTFNLGTSEMGRVYVLSDTEGKNGGKKEVKRKRRKSVVPALHERRIRIPTLAKAQTSPFTKWENRKAGRCIRFAAGPFGVRHPISPEEHHVIMFVYYGPGDDSDTLVDPSGPYSVRRSDFHYLLPDEWLISSLINTWAVILTNRARARGSLVRNWWLTLDFTFMASRPDESVLHLCKNQKFAELLFDDVTNCDKIFLPMHEPSHFFLFVVDLTLRNISVWDTLHTNSSVHRYIEKMDAQCKALDVVVKPPHFKFVDFQKVKRDPFPKQPNCNDCGLFVAYFMANPTKVGTLQPAKDWDSQEQRCRFLLDLILCEENQLSAEVQREASNWFAEERLKWGGVDVQKEQILSVDECEKDAAVTYKRKRKNTRKGKEVKH